MSNADAHGTSSSILWTIFVIVIGSVVVVVSLMRRRRSGEDRVSVHPPGSQTTESSRKIRDLVSLFKKQTLAYYLGTYGSDPSYDEAATAQLLSKHPRVAAKPAIYWRSEFPDWVKDRAAIHREVRAIADAEGITVPTDQDPVDFLVQELLDRAQQEARMLLNAHARNGTNL